MPKRWSRGKDLWGTKIIITQRKSVINGVLSFSIGNSTAFWKKKMMSHTLKWKTCHLKSSLFKMQLTKIFLIFYFPKLMASLFFNNVLCSSKYHDSLSFKMYTWVLFVFRYRPHFVYYPWFQKCMLKSGFKIHARACIIWLLTCEYKRLNFLVSCRTISRKVMRKGS